MAWERVPIAQNVKNVLCVCVCVGVYVCLVISVTQCVCHKTVVESRVTPKSVCNSNSLSLPIFIIYISSLKTAEWRHGFDMVLRNHAATSASIFSRARCAHCLSGHVCTPVSSSPTIMSASRAALRAFPIEMLTKNCDADIIDASLR